jgi:NAD(P)-dependent dehydrogenase (short-subunit alcohol dehydrogenase family)
MQIQGKTAVVTGAASGIGRAVMEELVHREASCVVAVDLSPSVIELTQAIGKTSGSTRLYAFTGNVTDSEFRRRVFNTVTAEMGTPAICVPAAGIARDRLAAKVDPETGRAQIYPLDDFRLVMEVNLVAPVYWALEMVGKIAEQRWHDGLKRWSPEEGIQGTVILIGSVSSQGNAGQISYSAAKAGLEGAGSTLMKEAIYHGVRCMVIHPGFTDTPMVHQLGDDYIKERILPATQLRRLIKPEEIADAVCFMIENPAVSGEVWADAGWHPSV